MRKTILDVILIGLLSVFAVACGDTGGDQFGEEPGFEQDLNEDPEGNVGQDEADAGEENQDDEEEDPGFDGPFCGDAFVDGDEECDDGNDQDGDGCSSACEVEAFEGETEGDHHVVGLEAQADRRTVLGPEAVEAHDRLRRVAV